MTKTIISLVWFRRNISNSQKVNKRRNASGSHWVVWVTHWNIRIIFSEQRIPFVHLNPEDQFEAAKDGMWITIVRILAPDVRIQNLSWRILASVAIGDGIVSYLMVNNYLWEELRKYRITRGEIVVWLMYSCWSRLQTINYFVPFNTPTLVSALEIM